MSNISGSKKVRRQTSVRRDPNDTAQSSAQLNELRARICNGLFGALAKE